MKACSKTESPKQNVPKSLHFNWKWRIEWQKRKILDRKNNNTWKMCVAYRCLLFHVLSDAFFLFSHSASNNVPLSSARMQHHCTSPGQASCWWRRSAAAVTETTTNDCDGEIEARIHEHRSSAQQSDWKTTKQNIYLALQLTSYGKPNRGPFQTATNIIVYEQMDLQATLTKPEYKKNNRESVSYLLLPLFSSAGEKIIRAICVLAYFWV